MMSAYAFAVTKGTVASFVLDGGDVDTSNWLRWLNCASTFKDQNVRAVTCYGRIYFVTIAAIYPRQELLVYYGDDYAKELGINVTEFHSLKIKG